MCHFQVWKKRFVVVRRPYVFLFRDERDHCERGMINLAQAKTEFSLGKQKHRKYYFIYQQETIESGTTKTVA